MKKIGLILYAIFFCLIVSAQQDISASATLDKNNILIGEHSNLRLSLSSSKPFELLEWPQMYDTIISEIEIIERTNVDTIITKTQYQYTQNLKLTSFDSGYYVIPPLAFKIKTENGIEEYLETIAQLFEVHTIEIDSTSNIKPISSVVNIPVTIGEVARKASFALAITVVVGLIIFLIYYFKKHKKIPNIIRPKPVVPANRKAIDSLYTLENKKLWQAGQVKEYYSEITDILREYIAGTYEIPAVEMITDDIFDLMKKSDKYQTDYYNLALSIFTLSDMVKFAKGITEADDNIKIMKDAYDFVNGSWKYISELKTKEENVE
ncbi:hypothetical protein LJC25_04650 [Bacteroidales bacterium OttesenSCG-928-K03]|nr:hypothetical protein [Odoribacter sp. OttesenSCG-928-L07]MDL2238652.1 hypothetical protein [Bacteroidales bacterium OttesenSCG-928-L14]MDL2240287.1 hypothetical protein [Bacteroidales bacterium OttesenSCG-928-K22]MDL2242999.1 hypothetical protein [Bacteroidales bacterium OttesenSCG-928-K03]